MKITKILRVNFVAAQAALAMTTTNSSPKLDGKNPPSFVEDEKDISLLKQRKKKSKVIAD